MEKLMLKVGLALVVSVLSLGAVAATKQIEVTAEVDNSIDMVTADGDQLPSSLQMQYIPNVGLLPYSFLVKFLTNDLNKDVTVKLNSPARLVNLAQPSFTADLQVKLGPSVLSETPTTFTSATLFPAGGGFTRETGSMPQTLEISQQYRQPLYAGDYSGVINLLIAQP